MAIDQILVGTFAQQLMQQLADTHGDDARIESIGIVVAVDSPTQSAVHFRFADGDGGILPRYRIKGLLEEIRDSQRAG